MTTPTTTRSFAELGVPAPIVAILRERGIHEPFPIQACTIPDLLAGRDLCGRAPTGSGKTLAFGIPLIALTGEAAPCRPLGLVLAPTRELANQISRELEMLSGDDGPSIAAVYGGVDIVRQIKLLRRGVDIVVGTPGRIADLVSQRQLRFDHVRTVVLDEADRMADMGFLPEVRRLLDLCPADRQTVLFSATLDGDVDVLVRQYQRDPARHEVEAAEDDSIAEHYFWSTDRHGRVAVAADVVRRMGATIVFTRTKHGADRVARQLGQAGVPAAAIHGDRSQSQRERALRSFHHGEVQALVATDVAARGIHVDDVACVVHFDPPADPRDYVHRSGRTARAGATGVVVTLVSPDVRAPVAGLQRSLGHPVGVSPVAVGSLPVDEAPARPARAPRPAPNTTPRNDRTERRDRTDGRDRTERRGPTSNRSPRARTQPERSSRDDATDDRPRRSSSGRPGARRNGSAPGARSFGSNGDPRSSRSTSANGAPKPGKAKAKRSSTGGGASRPATSRSSSTNGASYGGAPKPTRAGGAKGPKRAGSSTGATRGGAPKGRGTVSRSSSGRGARPAAPRSRRS